MCRSIGPSIPTTSYPKHETFQDVVHDNKKQKKEKKEWTNNIKKIVVGWFGLESGHFEKPVHKMHVKVLFSVVSSVEVSRRRGALINAPQCPFLFLLSANRMIGMTHG
jgi:hypothetical protein